VHEVRVLRGAAQRADHRKREQRRDPRPALDRVDDPAAVVGDAVVVVDARVHDLDLEPAGAQALDRVGDEAAGEIVGVAGIRSREEDDLQRLRLGRLRAASKPQREPGRVLGAHCPAYRQGFSLT